MIIFHEGLPRSGKSYWACVYHIIQALKSKRRVFACIAGLDHQKFADICNIEFDECKALLIQLKPDDINPENLPKLWGRFATGGKFIDDYGNEKNESLLSDSLLVIDEIQNHYPPGRASLDQEIMQFIAEHGHFGMDLLIMSQSWSSVHKAWRVRVQRKYAFTKRTAVGADNTFLLEAYEATTPEKFQKISTEIMKYDPLYFGLYKSHLDTTTNKLNLHDDRINIFKGFAFKYAVPIFFILVLVALTYLYRFFTGNPLKADSKPASHQERILAPESPKQNDIKPSLTNGIAEKPVQQDKKAEVKERSSIDYFDGLARVGHVRLSGHYSDGTIHKYFIEVLDHGGHDSENFTSLELIDMGWKLEIKSYGLVIQRENIIYVARSWPRNPWGKVTNDQSMAMKQ
jgi:zona occludens toxin